MANRYLEKTTPEQSPNLEDTLQASLVNIMKKEYPDDPLYNKGEVHIVKNIKESPAGIIKDSITPPEAIRKNGVVIVNPVSADDVHISYQPIRTIPSVDDDELDDIIDEEWDYFTIATDPIIDDAGEIAPVINIEKFIANQDLDLLDPHDGYITSGPKLISEGYDPSEVYCVFFISDGIAKPIPDYKTLEVMLVERGLTYQSITEATKEDKQNFDLAFDGEGGEFNTPEQEFISRSLTSMSGRWNHKVRFDSGYKPKAPFLRDPGDYINADDSDETYFDTVFQTQTYLEKLREKFEGNCIILNWPTNGAGADENKVDDLRMMINGYWKRIDNTDVLVYYNHIKDFGVNFKHSRFGENGAINTLVEAGGITDLNDDRLDSPVWPRPKLPVWNDFPHIAGGDLLDVQEYKDYIDFYSNSDDMWSIPYMTPYEPAGSTKYYTAGLSTQLMQEALAHISDSEDQTQQYIFNALVKSIEERWLEDFTVAGNLHNTFKDSQPKYFQDAKALLGLNGDVFNIWSPSEGEWDTRKNGKSKGSSSHFWKMVGVEGKILRQFSKSEEREMVNKYKWGLVPNNDLYADLEYQDFQGLASNALRNLVEVDNDGASDLPRTYGFINARAMKNNQFMDSMILAGQYGANASSILVQAKEVDDNYNTQKEALGALLSQYVLLGAALTEVDKPDQLNEIIAALDEFSAIVSETAIPLEDESVSNSVDNIIKLQITKMYSSIQYIRKQFHENAGNGNKWDITYPTSVQRVIKKYIPNAKFGRYLY